MRNIFTIHKLGNFARKTSIPFNVLALIKKISKIIVNNLKMSGKKSPDKIPATNVSDKLLTDDLTIGNGTHLQEEYDHTTIANDLHQLFHIKAQLAPDTGATIIQSTSSTKTYQITSIFDEETKEWVPCLSDTVPTYKNALREDDPPLNLSFLKGTATTILLVLFSVLGAFAHKLISAGTKVDAGYSILRGIDGPYGSIGALVWKDKNDNGTKDTNEPGIKNIIIELYTVNGSGGVSGSPVSKDTTDNSGHYLFANLVSGNYLVKIADSNLSDTLRISKKKDIGTDDTKDNDFSSATGYSSLITIHVDSTGNKKDNLTVDAALYTPIGSIGDYVWKDNNNNGIQDGGETGVNNAILELYAANNSGNPVGTALAKDTTNINGLYKFTNLTKGAYVLKLLSGSLPAGSIISTQTNLGADDKVDSDFNNITGLSPKITLDPDNDNIDPLNKENLTLDIAIYNPLGSIGDYVWKDADNDGVQDIDESGVKDVILHLYAANTDGTPTGSVLKADTTDINGLYLFSGLSQGEYVVQIVTSSLQAGNTVSDMSDKGGNDNADSDFSATTGYSPKISLDPTINDKKDILSIDAAIRQTVVCPTLTVSTIDGDICVGDSTFIKGITSNNATVKWYLSAVNGTVEFTSNSNESHLVFPTTTTTYYAEINGLNQACPNSRQPVVIVMNARPSLPSCAGVVDDCIGETIKLNDYVINGATTPGGTFEWRTTASEKSPLVSNPSSVGAGTYYLFEKSGAGCFSPPRMLKVNLKSCDTLIDLSLTKIVSTMTPKVLDNIVYTIKVTNDGAHAATNVEVEDQMPAGLEFISSSFFTKNGSMLKATISNIAAGQTITLNYIVKVLTVGDKINFAQISKADQKDVDSTPGNASTTSEDDNSKVIISPVQERILSDLSLEKTVNKNSPAIGEQITYFVTVINNGSNPATNVEVKDIVPAGLEVLTATGADNIIVSGNTVTAKFNSIEVGFAVTFQILTRVTASTGSIKNWAQITKSDQSDTDSTPDNGTGNGEDDTDDADITIAPSACNPPVPLIATSNLHICGGESILLNSVGCTGTVVWSTGATGNSITVNPTATTTYTAKCKLGDNCFSTDSNPITITANVITPPLVTSNAPNNTICPGGSVKLTATSCSGSVIWSNGTTASSITVSPGTNTSYTAICKTSTCTSSPSSPLAIIIGNSATTPTITASKTGICNGETVVLTASACGGTLTWSNGSTGTAISIMPGSTGTYSVTCASSGCGSQTSAPLTITVSPAAQTPGISADKEVVCAGANVNLTASNCNGTLLWSNGVSSSVIAVSPVITTVYEVTCSTGQCSAKSSKTITVKPQPAAPVIASAKETICAGESVVLTAHNCDGKVTWSTGATTATITVSPTITTAYTAICNVDGCNSVSSASVSVIVSVTTPTITATKDIICEGGSSTLTASNCSGTLLWSNGQTTTSITVDPVATITYTVTCTAGSCNASASKNITVNTQTITAPVIATANANLCAGGNVTLTATGCAGTVVWSNTQTGTSITINLTGSIVVAAACKIGDCESEKSNNITLTVGTISKPVLSANQTTICIGDAAILSSSACNGNLIWSNGLTGSSITVNPVTTTEYTAVCKAAQGNCTSSESDKLKITVSSQPEPPIIVCTCAKSTICKGDTLTLKAIGCLGTFVWSNGQSASSIVVSPEVTTAYTVKCKIGSCESAPSAAATVNVGIPAPPLVSSNKTQICSGNSIILEAAGCVGTVKWSDGHVGTVINVSPSAVTSYWAICDAGKCQSEKSNTITIQVSGSGLTKPTTKDLVNVCPFTHVDLTTGVTSALSSIGGTFTFRSANNPDSTLSVNPSSVGTGSYYVFEKTGNGCYSEGSRINVQIITCTDPPADTSQIELGISIVGSRVELQVGDQLTYTITVTNNTMHTATNVHITNVLPKGITITSATPGFTAFGTDSLVSVIGTFPGGAVKTYVYTAKTTKAGTIRNIAKIAKIDQVDPILANNISHWDIHCSTCQETCVGTSLAADTTRQSNGSYNITFRAFVETCGNVKLEDVKITEDLAAMFPSPVTFTIIQKPTVGVLSKLIPNNNFNGITDLNLTVPTGSEIEPGVIDTVKFVINIVPNGNEGPFSTNTLVEAIGNTSFGIPQDVSDVSNNGIFIDKPSAEPTVIRLFKSPSIGLAKIVSDSTKKTNGSFDITYRLFVKNNGSLPLNNVVLTDTLSKVFNLPATFTVLGTPVKNAGSQLIINNAFNGSTDTRLTLPGSTLGIGQTDTLDFSVNLQPDTIKLFSNTAKVSASGTLTAGGTQSVTDISNAGTNPDAPGSNPTNLNLDPGGMSSIEIPCIGIALYVKDTIRQVDGSYNIVFHSIIKNCGNLTLSNIQLCDTLSNTFPAPVQASVKFLPSVSAGSRLISNPDYNGTTNTCLLLSESVIEPGRVDTVKWTINVKLNGNKGPFRNSVIVSGKTPAGLIISDISNDGINPNPTGSTPTIINFNSLPEALIGISKEAGEPTKVGDRTFDVTFRFKVKNYGKTDFTGVQVQDNLAVTFGDSVRIDSVSVTADAGFVLDSNYTGRGNLINLLVDSLSTLPKNTTRNITLFTRVTLTKGMNTFTNQALVVGKYPTNKSVDDLSTNGTDPDPDSNGNPKDNSIATPINIEGFTPGNITSLGIAKSVELDSIPNADDTYNLTYRFILKNYSTRTLSLVQLSDTLENVFADSTNFIIAAPPTLSAGSTLKLNPDFNGRLTSTMLIADSSSLAPGASDTLELKLRILTDKKEPAIYFNSAYGSAKDTPATITDISQTGIDPDYDDDGNPGNDNAPTLVTIGGEIPEVLDSTAVIPGGFSPNNDGVGDTFFIPGINKTSRVAKIYIYNRWGMLVYKNEDYGKSEGWDGKANNGIVLLSDGKQVPDGTYYYVIEANGLWNDKPTIGFITIAR